MRMIGLASILFVLFGTTACDNDSPHPTAAAPGVIEAQPAIGFVAGVIQVGDAPRHFECLPVKAKIDVKVGSADVLRFRSQRIGVIDDPRRGRQQTVIVTFAGNDDLRPYAMIVHNDKTDGTGALDDQLVVIDDKAPLPPDGFLLRREPFADEGYIKAITICGNGTP